MDKNLIKHGLWSSYSKKTAHYSVEKKRTETNRFLGQCAISALLIREMLGGDIIRADVDNYGISHYWNKIDGETVDLTIEQFNADYPNFINISSVDPKLLTSNADTNSRYRILRERFEEFLQRYEEIEQQVLSCRKCSQVDHFGHQSTYFGGNCSLLFIGEAPAKNGWKVTGKAWINEKGNVIPSGKILGRLLDGIGINLFDTTFTEAIKCLPHERKYLKTAMQNCQFYLYKQIDLLKPNVLITLGDHPTRGFLDYKKFGDVAGNAHKVEINGKQYILLPIYHPSPISPRSYKSNVPIFNTLSLLLKH